MRKRVAKVDSGHERSEERVVGVKRARWGERVRERARKGDKGWRRSPW